MMAGGITRLIMLLLLGFPLLANAGARDSTRVESLRVKGKVMDETGIPLPGVTVRLDSTTVGSVTGQDGTFYPGIQQLVDRVDKAFFRSPLGH